MDNFIETFYGILFEPVKTFKTAKYDKPYKLPLILVLLASFFLLILSEKSFTFLTIMTFISKSVNLLIYWIFFAFFINLMAKMFNAENNFSKLLTLMSYSFVPWIFLAPLKLMKHSSITIFSDIAIILLLGVWIWTIALQILAISETYNITRKNAIVIILIPFLGFILYLTWTVDFFIKLFQIAGL